MSIRSERGEDTLAIHTLTQAAFRTAAHTDGNEAQIIAALREAGALSVSLVAERDGAIIGHVALSPVTIAGHDGAQWYGLGPLSVHPADQRQGVGGSLVRAAIEQLRARAAGGCVLLGDPDYYARFGFELAAPLVLEGVPPAYFRALLLSGGQPRGQVCYHRAFTDTAG